MKWELVKLGEVFKITSGGTPNRKKEQYFQNGTIPWVKTGDLKGKYVKMPPEFITQEALKNSSAKVFPEDTVLLAMYGATIGACSILPFSAATNQACAALLPSEKCDSVFLFYYLLSIKKDLIQKGVGGAQPNISGGIIKDTKIHLPPLSTQKKIAAILDAADAHRQKTKQLLAKYDELAQSIFLEMFGDSDDEKICLSELIEINPKKSEISSLDKETEVSFVPMADVSEEGDMNNTLTKKISEVWSGFTYFREDDVVFAKITPCMENGKGAIARTLVNGIGFGTTEFHVLRPKKGLSTSSWIFQLTHSKFFRKQAESNMTGSAGQKRVPKDFFFNFKIPRPAFESQLRFEQILNNIKLQKFEIKKEVEKADDLFNCLLKRTFKGELVK